MNRTILLPWMFASFAAASFAAKPIATVSSAQPFTLDGRSMSVAGVSSWPIVLGDQIATLTAPATIRFVDGSRITLGVQSIVSLAGAREKPLVILGAGSLDYNLVKNSNISLAKSLTEARKTNYSVTASAKSPISPVVIVSAAAAGIAIPASVVLASSHAGAATMPVSSVATTATQTTTAASTGTISTTTMSAPSAAGVTPVHIETAAVVPPRLPPVSHFQ